MALVETGCLVVALTVEAAALTAVAVERTFLGVIIDLGPEAGLTVVAMGLTGVAAVLMAHWVQVLAVMNLFILTRLRD
jgi:hypothetical protein